MLRSKQARSIDKSFKCLFINQFERRNMYIMFISYGDGTHQTTIHFHIESLEEFITHKLDTKVTKEMDTQILSIAYGGKDSYYHVFDQHNGNDSWFSISYFINRKVALCLLAQPVPTPCYNKDDLTIEDRQQIFVDVLDSASDLTQELLDELSQNYATGGIKFVE